MSLLEEVKAVEIQGEPHLFSSLDVFKKIKTTWFKEIFDVHSHEFTTFDPEERIEILRYLMSLDPEREKKSDDIGGHLWLVLDACNTYRTSVQKKDELSETEERAWLLYLAEYLIFRDEGVEKKSE